MTQDELKDFLREHEFEDSVVFENPSFATAVIGYTENGAVIYDYDKMAEELAAADDISLLEAYEFIDYNTLRAIPYIGEGVKPIVMYRVDNE